MLCIASHLAQGFIQEQKDVGNASNAPAAPPASAAAGIRSDMVSRSLDLSRVVSKFQVDAAIKFMTNPSVKGSPVSKQIAFLEGKGSRLGSLCVSSATEDRGDGR